MNAMPFYLNTPVSIQLAKVNSALSDIHLEGGTLIFHVPISGKITISLYNGRGAVCYQQKIQGGNGLVRVSLESQKCFAGAYLATIVKNGVLTGSGTCILTH